MLFVFPNHARPYFRTPPRTEIVSPAYPTQTEEQEAFQAFTPHRWTYYDASIRVLLNEDAVDPGAPTGGHRLDIHVIGIVPYHPLMREMSDETNRFTMC